MNNTTLPFAAHVNDAQCEMCYSLLTNSFTPIPTSTGALCDSCQAHRPRAPQPPNLTCLPRPKRASRRETWLDGYPDAA